MRLAELMFTIHKIFIWIECWQFLGYVIFHLKSIWYLFFKYTKVVNPFSHNDMVINPISSFKAKHSLFVFIQNRIKLRSLNLLHMLTALLYWRNHHMLNFLYISAEKNFLLLLQVSTLFSALALCSLDNIKCSFLGSSEYRHLVLSWSSFSLDFSH